MLNIRRGIVSGVVVLACALGCILAVGPVAHASVDAKKQEISIAFTEEPPTLNSMRATDQVSFLVLGHTMEGLARYDKNNRLAPGVAERWEVTDKGAKFYLRKNAKWSDGKPVTAQDFVFAWRNVVNPKTASEYTFILYPIKNAETISKGKADPSTLGVKALDSHTLEVAFEKPCGYFVALTAFATYFPVREDFFASRGDRYAANAQDLLYNGPFKLVKWVHSASLRFEKNDQYWNTKDIKLSAIDVPYITTDTRAVFNLFKDKKIAVAGLDSETLKDAMKNNYKLKKFADGSVFYMEFNFRDGRPTRSKSLRKAIQAAFDPKELVDKVIALPGNLPAYSLFPLWLKGVKDDFRKEFPVRRVTNDLAAAKKHLEAAKKELGVQTLPSLVLLADDGPTAEKQSEYLQNVFKTKLGLDLKIDKQTFKQRLAKMTSGEFDIVAAGWGPDFDDPMTFADLFASWNLNNRGRYNSPELDALVREAQSLADNKKRMGVMAKIQDHIINDVVVLPQYERGRVYVQTPELKGVVRSVIGADPNYTHAYVAP